MLKKYRKRPVEIEAIQYVENNGDAITNWSEGKVIESWVEKSEKNPTGHQIFIKTLEGMMTASYGDYIIKGIAGEFYPCKADIFEKTYEEVQKV